MYSIKVEPPDDSKPVVNRKMVADAAIQLLPVIVDICKAEYKFINPVAVYLGDGKYYIFDLCNPAIHATVTIKAIL